MISSFLSSTFAPAPGGVTYYQAAASLVTAADSIATASIRVEVVGATTNIYARYQGDAGGGNFIMLDGLEWWH